MAHVYQVPSHIAQYVRAVKSSPVGDRRNRGNNLDRGNAHLLPHRKRSDRIGRPVLQRPQQPVIFSGEFDAGRLAYSEGANRIVEAGRAELQRHFDRPHVARVRQNFFHGQDAKRVPVVNHPPGKLDLAHLAINQGIGVRHTIFNRAGEREHLERRARLVRGAYCAIHSRLVGVRTGVVGIERGPVRHSEKLA